VTARGATFLTMPEKALGDNSPLGRKSGEDVVLRRGSKETRETTGKKRGTKLREKMGEGKKTIPPKLRKREKKKKCGRVNKGTTKL